MLRFTLFGIPVVVEPWFWLTTFLLGGGINWLSGGSSSELLWILVWMVVAFFSILVHEYGHALTARKHSGGHNHIRLWGMGGLAYHEGSRQTREARLATIAMGPGAGLTLFCLTCLVMLFVYGHSTGLSLVKYLTIPYSGFLTPEALDYVSRNEASVRLFRILIYINFWWSLLNLLPVFPLDGGQLLAEYTGKPKLAHTVGFITAGAMAAFAFLFLKSIFIGVLFGFLALQNLQGMQGQQPKL
ncbi:MAG: hypothetical protein Q7Q71_03595 [Verrucomicrobiota bacterium JB023]|nr:hypothetical protein [Verrucomicrobiota bacterium JB023]